MNLNISKSNRKHIVPPVTILRDCRFPIEVDYAINIAPLLKNGEEAVEILDSYGIRGWRIADATKIDKKGE